MYLLIHSLVLVLVAVMKPKELKTKISHANPLTLSRVVCVPLTLRVYVCVLSLTLRASCACLAARLSDASFSSHDSLLP